MGNISDSVDTPAARGDARNLPLERPRHPWRRFVAIGDSFTEGIGDPDPASPGGHRGWADRVAEELSRGVPDFAYANLAIRGRMLAQISDEQLQAAIDLRADLVSVCAGGNDVIRIGGDPDALGQRMDKLVGTLAATGATVVLFTGPDIGATPVLGTSRARVAIYNENLRAVAARHDAVVADLWALRELNQQWMWAPDRLHFSPMGHHTIAMMVLDTLNVPHSLSPLEPREAQPKRWRTARREDLVWARTHLAPWVLRGLRHRSTGDGVAPKRPLAAPFATGSVGAGDPATRQA